MRVALDVLEGLKLAEIHFVPSARPPHRSSPMATPQQRLAMLEQAVAGQAGFLVDSRELKRDGPSYTIDTLASLRAERPDTPLCLLLGWDAFREFDVWYRWREIPSLAHIVIVHRPDVTRDLPAQLDRWARRYSGKPLQGPAGSLSFQPVTQLAISASAIRAALAENRSPRYLLPEAVLDYIRHHQLYTR